MGNKSVLINNEMYMMYYLCKEKTNKQNRKRYNIITILRELAARANQSLFFDILDMR